MTFIRIEKSNGSLQRLKDDWERQCGEYGELLENYAVATMPVLEALAGNPEDSAGVYATESEGHISSICQLNCTGLPGYDSPVLRMRLLTVSPRYDFGDLEVDDYARVLVEALTGILTLSYDGALKARYINFHLRSPADRAFFAAIQVSLGSAGIFKNVKLAGSWLYITKN